MSKNLVGIVTFGNVDFTKLTYISMMNTTIENDLDFYFIVGKPGDSATINFLKSIKCNYKVHDRNMGFPYSLNDIYDFAWKQNNYDNLIIAGNDIVVYPYAMDSLINYSNETNTTVVSALQYDVKSLVNQFPHTRRLFTGPNLIFNDFNSTPWDEFKDYKKEYAPLIMQLFDIQNLCLYKKECFYKVGYTDVNYYPAYFVDNDYALRIWRAGLSSATLANARFFHFWSRTIHQGSGGSTNKYFQNNMEYYKRKWGGMPTQETKTPDIFIGSREKEIEQIDYWRTRG